MSEKKWKRIWASQTWLWIDSWELKWNKTHRSFAIWYPKPYMCGEKKKKSQDNWLVFSTFYWSMVFKMSWYYLTIHFKWSWPGHFVIHVSVCMYAKSLQLCPTLCHPLDCVRLLLIWDSPGKHTGVGRHAPSRGSSPPRDWTCDSYVSCIGRRVLHH